MSHFEEQFKAVLAKWLREEPYQLDVYEVHSYNQSSYERGSCETCSFTEIVVDINYSTSGEEFETFTYSGSLNELLAELP